MILVRFEDVLTMVGFMGLQDITVSLMEKQASTYGSVPCAGFISRHQHNETKKTSFQGLRGLDPLGMLRDGISLNLQYSQGSGISFISNSVAKCSTVLYLTNRLTANEMSCLLQRPKYNKAQLHSNINFGLQNLFNVSFCIQHLDDHGCTQGNTLWVQLDWWTIIPFE